MMRIRVCVAIVTMIQFALTVVVFRYDTKSLVNIWARELELGIESVEAKDMHNISS
jgi:hypothetical protein